MGIYWELLVNCVTLGGYCHFWVGLCSVGYCTANVVSDSIWIIHWVSRLVMGLLIISIICGPILLSCRGMGLYLCGCESYLVWVYPVISGCGYSTWLGGRLSVV